MGKREPHPVYKGIDTITSLNSEKRSGHTGEEESRMRIGIGKRRRERVRVHGVIYS